MNGNQRRSRGPLEALPRRSRGRMHSSQVHLVSFRVRLKPTSSSLVHTPVQCALKLQRISRGHLARRRSKLREEGERRQVARWTVAVSLQRIWRGRRDRLRFRERASRRLRSVLLIQSAYRGFRARRGRRDRMSDLAVASVATGEGRRGGDTGETSPPGHRGPTTRETWSQTDESWGRDSHGRATVGASVNDREEKIREEMRFGSEDGVEIHHALADVSSNLDLSPGHRGRTVVHGGSNLIPTAANGDEGNVAAEEAANSSRQTMTSDAPTATFPSTEVELSPPHPAATGNEDMVRVEAPPLLESTVEYYEARQKYIAAQERVHGASASKVQSFFRMCAAGFRANALRIKKEKLRQEHDHRCRAALKLQAEARARSARKAVGRKRAALERAQRREKAAVSLQCTARLYSARRQLQQLREAEEARLKRRNKMAARIQARARGVQTREVWRRFFRSRALLERERQRVGARRIQGLWRSKLARTELERRKGIRDEALLAQELERHLESILQGVMEAERRHAYAVRLQCWWRRIRSRKIKLQKSQRESKEDDSIVPDGEGEQRAALAIQTSWRRYQARSYFFSHFTALFNQRERKKYCTECQGQYATRICDTCIDKFCERCWAYMHSKGERRFHHWKPFSPFTYEVVRPGGETDGARPGYAQHEGVGHGGYSFDSDGRALTKDNGASVAQYQENISYTTEQRRDIDTEGIGGNGTWVEGTWEDASGWISAPAQGSSLSYGVHQDDAWGNEWYQPAGTSAAGDDAQEYPPTGWGKEWTEYYGSASQYPDDSPWSQHAVGDPGQFDGGGGSKIAEQTLQPWGGYDQEVQQQRPGKRSSSHEAQAWESGGYYAGYQGEGGTAFEQWATCDGTYSSDVYGLSVHPAGSEGMTNAGQGGSATGGGDAGDGLWSVNEFGQRVSGDWVEYWDESAQATYFYNNVTGEASWTEPVLG